MRLKIDKEFEKVKIKDLNEMNNVKCLLYLYVEVKPLQLNKKLDN